MEVMEGLCEAGQVGVIRGVVVLCEYVHRSLYWTAAYKSILFGVW